MVAEAELSEENLALNCVALDLTDEWVQCWFELGIIFGKQALSMGVNREGLMNSIGFPFLLY